MKIGVLHYSKLFGMPLIRIQHTLSLELMLYTEKQLKTAFFALLSPPGGVRGGVGGQGTLWLSSGFI